MVYQSCGFINHGLEFRADKNIYVCSQLSHIGGGNIILYSDVSTKNFDVDVLLKNKEEVQKIARSGNVLPNCIGCTDLQNWSKDRELSKFKLLMIQHWTKCNSNCIYCFSAKNKKFYNEQKTYDIYPILKMMHKKGALDKNGLANFSGGEFTCLKEADKVVIFLSKLNYFIIVNTSGVDYSRTLASRIKKGNSCIVISVDAGKEETHRKIKQVKSFKKVWKNIEKYAKLQKESYLVNVKFIIIPTINDTQEEIDIWLDNCVKAKVKNVVLGIDANYFEPNRNNIPSYIFELFRHTLQKSQDLGLNFYIANRALTMLTKGKYADPFWEQYRYDDGKYSELYFKNNSI